MTDYQFDIISDIIETDMENMNYKDIYKLRDYLNDLVKTRIDRLFDDDYLENKKDLLLKDIQLLLPDIISEKSVQTSLKHIFSWNNIYCLADLIQLTQLDLIKIRHLGEVRIKIINDYLLKNGLSFGMELTKEEKMRLQIYKDKLNCEIKKSL